MANDTNPNNVTTSEGKALNFDDLVSTEKNENIAALVPHGSSDLIDTDEVSIGGTYRNWTSKPKFRPEDLVYPKLRIGQGTTPEVQQSAAKPGDLILTGYPPLHTVTLIPLLCAMARELRDLGDNRKTLCQSMDAVVGVGTPGGNCEHCPMSQWSGSRDTKRLPPQCNLIYSYISWSVEHEQIVVTEFKRTSKGVANFLNVNFDSRGSGNFAVSMTTQSNTNANKQTYYVPIVTFASNVSDEIFDRARAAIT